ncbi:hypothetical protein L3X38_006463 [Prunus dulcis]|uniref:Integrase catalytic domain-containing protein n=1 Tax=Prunus dulcis TaxID=3755 RepID=A0AAD5F541_PRUDU|nr:hypothetical protein L3X38_006463 [Prunus dulcis]
MGDNSFVGAIAATSENLCGSDCILGTSSNTWIIDTGASDHMTYDAIFFDELFSNTRDPYITSANGLPSPITGEDTISLIPTLSLSSALLVPSIHCNLLSIGRLLDTLNASATLYYLTLPSAPVRDRVVHTVQSCSMKDKQQIWLWHRRLGHLSFGYLKRLFSSLFRSCDESSFKCETCILAKSHRTVFPLSDSKATKPFDLFHDRVKVFRTDNGGEYVNNPLTHFFRNQCIIHQTTTSFTPQQNGVSERKNCHLLEVARSIILDMSVPHHLWGHGILAATHLINRTPSRVLDFKTSLDVLCAHTSPVFVSKLPPKVFGCVAYVHIYSHQRSKLDPSALRCVFIGYSTTQKGYK